MKQLDFFEDLTLDFIPMSNVTVEAQVEQIVQNVSDLENQIDKLESRVLSIERDIETISELGLRLQDESARTNLKQLAEDFMMENDVNDIRVKLSELYGARQSIGRALDRLAMLDESINYTCGVCMERAVTMFNPECGHTFCVNCANKVTRCPFCRGTANFKRLVFSS